MAKWFTSGFGHTGGLSYIIVHHAFPIMEKIESWHNTKKFKYVLDLKYLRHC